MTYWLHTCCQGLALLLRDTDPPRGQDEHEGDPGLPNPLGAGDAGGVGGAAPPSSRPSIGVPSLGDRFSEANSTGSAKPRTSRGGGSISSSNAGLLLFVTSSLRRFLASVVATLLPLEKVCRAEDTVL